MNISDNRIDKGKEFDWGKTSEDYAKFRDVYPKEFYNFIIDAGLCTKGQKVLDIGTGTGVLPRNLCAYGAEFIGADISDNQINAARTLSKEYKNNITYIVSSAEKLDFPDNTFDVITACQCFHYFNYEVIFPKLAKMLKPGGRFAVMLMGWLPEESKIVAESERLVLKYNPEWSGCGETRHYIDIPDCAFSYFEIENRYLYDIDVPFTKETWNGRIKSCRGIGASLDKEQIALWESEHLKMLDEITDNSFTIKHFAAMTVLKVKK